MSSISGLGSTMNMMGTANMNRPDKQQMFNKVDTDGGGTIDKVELSTLAKELLEKTGVEINVDEAMTTYDTDGDSALSQEEMDEMMKASMPVPPPPPMMGETEGMEPPDKAEMFASIDTDSSGAISEEELTTFLEQLKEDTGIERDAEEALTSYDTDGDGVLSQEEMDGMMAANMPEPPSAPPVSEQAISAYNQNSGEEDLLSTLLSTLDDNSDEENSSLLNIKG